MVFFRSVYFCDNSHSNVAGSPSRLRLGGATKLDYDTGVKEPQPLGKGPSLGWQWKAIIPIIGVLLLGLIAFQAIVVALDIPSGHWILIVAAGGAVTICFVMLAVLLVLIERPLEELKKIIGRVSEGDLSAKVEFAKRNDDVGQLGRQFNEMIRQLAENRAEAAARQFDPLCIARSPE